MFSCTLKKATSFKKLISSIPPDIKLGDFYFQPDILELQGYNEKSEAMVILKINASSFSSYECVDKLITFKRGVKVDALKKILTLMKAKDELSMNIKCKEVSAIIFQYASKKRVCDLKLRTFSRGAERLEIDAPFEVEFEIKLHDIHSICQDLLKIGNKITINVSKAGKIEFKSSDTDIDVSFVGEPIQMIKTAQISFSYNLEYIAPCLNSFISSKVSNKITMKMHTNLPLCLQATTSIGTIQYYVAPLYDC